MSSSDHNDILSSLDGMQRASCPADMGKRVFEAYMAKPVGMWDKAVILFSNPMYAAACIIGIILINLLLVLTSGDLVNSQIATTDLTSANATLFEQNDSYSKP